MKIIIQPGESKNVLATNAIGGNFFSEWQRWAFPTWEKYCKRHGLGLIVFDEYIIHEDPEKRKQPHWQKLLIGYEIKRNLPEVNSVCFLDTDILINYTAPNVFNSYDINTVALISRMNNIPYPLMGVLRRIAFLRHHCFDQNYPLDSFLFASIPQIYERDHLSPQKEYACTGFFVFNIKNHADMLCDWYHKYTCNNQTQDGCAEQTFLNWELQNWGKVSWMDYRFQALWIYEMAWKYPFLYHYGRFNERLVGECIEASLFSNYFLHFAGSWEGNMWKRDGILESRESNDRLCLFNEYEKVPLTGKPVGIVKPKQKI